MVVTILVDPRDGEKKKEKKKENMATKRTSN